MAEYNPTAIEKKWQSYWDEKKTFKVTLPTGKKFYCLDMFPYPSGKGLHVGHPLGYTATDILSRFMRMKGYSVLHPMGFDAFGLPAEQHAVATGEHPAFITHKNCEVFTSQLKMVGLSYDWDRSLETCDPKYYRWTQWIFLKIYNSWFDEKLQKARPIDELPVPPDVTAKGALAIQQYQAQHRLAFYADGMVNWCPALGTVLANEEVIDGRSERGGHEVIRKPMKQWFLRITKYAERLLNDLETINWPENIKEQQRNWIGKRLGAEIVFRVDGSSESLTAFTTRPDTLFGVTFFVISPEHPIVHTVTTADRADEVKAYQEKARKLSDLDRTIENRQKTGVFTGSYVINPITGDKVPLYVGDYVLMSYGTGAVMGVPAHDERDFEFAKNFGISIRPVIVPAGLEDPSRELVARGERCWTEPGVMLSSASPVARDLKLEGIPNERAGELIVGWLEAGSLGRQVVNYKLRDWLFSRQRYWGEPIPIVHWEDGTVTALDERELPLTLPEVDDYRPSEGGESPLARAAGWVMIKDPVTGKSGRRETNTMPQWAGSCWYYLRFIDPLNASEAWDPALERAWMNVDMYVGGAEHAVLHLLYSRFWHKVLYDLGFVSTNEPFQRLFNQGMVQAYAYKNARGALVPVDEVEELEDGSARHKVSGEPVERLVAKMSKSLRNVVTLDETIKFYGADTFRLYLMFMGPLDVSRPWDTKAINGVHRFLKRVWVFCTQNQDTGLRPLCGEAEESRQVKKGLHGLIRKVGEDIEGMRFNTSIAAMMEFLNLAGDAPISRKMLESFILVIAPFAPHIAEEVWQRLGHRESLANESWPSYDPTLLVETLATVVIQVGGKKRATIEVPVSISESELKSAVTAKLKGTQYEAAQADKIITVYQPGTKVPRLVNVVKS